MQAKATNYLAVLSHQHVGNETCVEVTCRDYDHWCKLPEVIDVGGALFARTGWSSDRQVACYKNKQLIAYPIG